MTELLYCLGTLSTYLVYDCFVSRSDNVDYFYITWSVGHRIFSDDHKLFPETTPENAQCFGESALFYSGFNKTKSRKQASFGEQKKEQGNI